MITGMFGLFFSGDGARCLKTIPGLASPHPSESNPAIPLWIEPRFFTAFSGKNLETVLPEFHTEK